MREQRPVSRDDLVRVLLLLDALHLVTVDGEPAPLYEALADQHELREEALTATYTDEEVGDDFVAREFHHARLVLEAVLHHDGQLPAGPLPVPLKPCNTPGCPERVHGALCMSCELERGGVS